MLIQKILVGRGTGGKTHTILYAKEYIEIYILHILYLLDSWSGMKEGRQVQGIVHTVQEK